MTPTPSPTPAALGTVEPTLSALTPLQAAILQAVVNDLRNRTEPIFEAVVLEREAQARKEERERLGLVELQDTLINAAQLIDGIRQGDPDWKSWWTEWDQRVRDDIGTALARIRAGEP